MNAPIFVIDTHAIAWFAKGFARKLGLNALVVMSHPRARVIVASYSLEEIQRKLEPRSEKAIKIPRTALLRLLGHCSNVRILPRGPACLAAEFRLHRQVNKSGEGVPVQDIPIAAAVLVAKEHYKGPVVLITSDGKLKRWASNVGVTVVWNQFPFQWLPVAPGRAM